MVVKQFVTEGQVMPPARPFTRLTSAKAPAAVCRDNQQDIDARLARHCANHQPAGKQQAGHAYHAGTAEAAAAAFTRSTDILKRAQ
ncbi:hypothetical protein M8494_11810 [Serratia ureilytica]